VSPPKVRGIKGVISTIFVTPADFIPTLSGKVGTNPFKIQNAKIKVQNDRAKVKIFTF
jgi:hypothetical protein